MVFLEIHLYGHRSLTSNVDRNACQEIYRVYFHPISVTSDLFYRTKTKCVADGVDRQEPVQPHYSFQFGLQLGVSDLFICKPPTSDF